MKRYSKADIAAISAEIGGAAIPDDWSGLDAVRPLLERIMKEGATVLIKWDGERRPEAGEHPYTAIVQSGPLGSDFYRTDAPTLEDALCYILGNYADRTWRG